MDAQKNEEPILMTIRDVAYHMQVSTRTVEKLLQAGELRSVRFGRSSRVLRTDFDAFVLSKRVDPR